MASEERTERHAEMIGDWTLADVNDLADSWGADPRDVWIEVARVGRMGHLTAFAVWKPKEER